MNPPNTELRNIFLYNAIVNEVAAANRAVNNGDDDKTPYLQAGRAVLAEYQALATERTSYEPPRLTTYGDSATLTGKGNP